MDRCFEDHRMLVVRCFLPPSRDSPLANDLHLAMLTGAFVSDSNTGAQLAKLLLDAALCFHSTGDHQPGTGVLLRHKRSLPSDWRVSRHFHIRGRFRAKVNACPWALHC